MMNSIEEIHLVTKELELVEAQITLAQRKLALYITKAEHTIKSYQEKQAGLRALLSELEAITLAD